MNSKNIQDLTNLKTVVESIKDFYKREVIDVNQNYDLLVELLSQSNEKVLREYARYPWITEFDVETQRVKLKKQLECIVEGIEKDRKISLQTSFQNAVELIERVKEQAKENWVSQEVLDCVEWFKAQVIQLFPKDT